MRQPDRIIVRYSEIALKGKNRLFFERILANNIQSALNCQKIRLRPGRLVMLDMPENFIHLKYVFGISSFSAGWSLKSDPKVMSEVAVSLLLEGNPSTFAIRARRQVKSTPFSSESLNREIGSHVQKTLGLDVNLSNPDKTIYFELWKDETIAYTEKIPGPGGIPAGTEGVVEVSIKDIRDELAALMAMKRGCKVFIRDGKPNLLKKYLLGQAGRADEIAATILSDSGALLLALDSDLPVLRPLIGFSDKMLDNQILRMK